MDNEPSKENLRKSLLLSPLLNEKSLVELLQLFSFHKLEPNEYFIHEGEYPLSLAFIEKGIFYSYFSDAKGDETVRGIFIPGMYVLPLPAFIFRKPSFTSYKVITESFFFQAKYAEIQALSEHNVRVKSFIQSLIDREWIINREIHDASIHVYNFQTRYNLFREKYALYISKIPVQLLSSYLNIPLRQLQKIQNQGES